MNTSKNLFLVLGEWWQQWQESRSSQRVWNWHVWLPSRGNVLFTTLIIALLLWAQTVGAFTPLTINSAASTSAGTIAYQGRLANAGGTPLTQTIGMEFRLYTAATGGAPVWTEQWTGSNSVQVSDGLFNVMLGSLTPIPQNVIAANSNLFLGITVGTDSEMSPRVQLGSVPFAVQALTVPDGSITTAKLAADIQFIPAGAIIMWGGDTSAIPSGWRLCDGSAGTPDLRDRFVVGAGSSYAVGATGGANQVTLSIDQIPSHTHSYTDKYANGRRVNGSAAWNATSDKDPEYSIDNKTTGAAGGGQPHENRPPYYAVAFICKQ